MTSAEGIPRFPLSTEAGADKDGLSDFVSGAADAEDMVRDVWLRRRSARRSPPAYLAITTTQLRTHIAGSADEGRKNHVGRWLPKPRDTNVDSGLDAERAEALQLAVLLQLEKLPPAECTKYVLRRAPSKVAVVSGLGLTVDALSPTGPAVGLETVAAQKRCHETIGYSRSDNITRSYAMRGSRMKGQI